MRIGHGFDAHRFSSEGDLILGGVTLDTAHKLQAHSDGDVLLHAVCDALLGAAGLGDIGKHFPDNDNNYKDADSRDLLRQVVKKIHDKDYEVGNLDVTVIAQTPRLAEHINAMKENIATDTAVSSEQVNIKATTTEKMGYIGREEGIAVHAVVLLLA
ncbi:MAG: 2-C-methyl-D-erythritol 2,4-cyclodiphosphate synthase [Gammaproteobacteria bacterium]|nr:2-C-methyl-D-erythritol 2,4-cyclodiphosphate synthase [Gammaproteobacteria bacterium]MCP4414131.1 2-C-methyl-D-erythritol 2,4-cyclodiphosphate synthase [Gammaproteobacteria bacterium]